MREYRKTAALTSRGLYLRKRIARNRERAKFVGLLYLLASVALAVTVCMPLLSHELASLKITTFWKTFKPSVLKGLSRANVDLWYKVTISGLYALMLVGLFVNVLRSFGRLGWLIKKSANKEYGFNRNVYAMEDLGRIFSGSYLVATFTYFLIAVVCNGWKGQACEPNKIKMLSVLGGGAVIHLLCGVIGACSRYYDFEKGEIVEEVRGVGVFAPFLRNLLQLIAVFALMYFYLRATTVNTIIPELLKKGGVKSYFKSVTRAIDLGAQIALLLCLLALAKHATGMAEYNVNGVYGKGMKNFRVFSFFTLLIAGGVVAYKYVMGKSGWLNKNLLIMAGIAFVAFVIELIMRNMPKFREEKHYQGEEEFTIDEVSKQMERRVDQSF